MKLYLTAIAVLLLWSAGCARADEWDFHYGRGKELLSRGARQEAVAEFEAARAEPGREQDSSLLKLTTGNRYTLYCPSKYLGEIFLKLGQVDDAVASLERSLRDLQTEGRHGRDYPRLVDELSASLAEAYTRAGRTQDAQAARERRLDFRQASPAPPPRRAQLRLSLRALPGLVAVTGDWLAPAAEVSDALDVEVSWKVARGLVEVTHGGHSMLLTIAGPEATIGGQSLPVSPPRREGDTVLLPLRVLCEQLLGKSLVMGE